MVYLRIPCERGYVGSLSGTTERHDNEGLSKCWGFLFRCGRSETSLACSAGKDRSVKK